MNQSQDKKAARIAHPRRKLVAPAIFLGALVIVGMAATAWLGVKASVIKGQMDSALALIPQLKANMVGDRPTDAADHFEAIRSHTASARRAADDPVWTVASALPWIGTNFGAVSEIVRTADDVATFGVGPLVGVVDSLRWSSLLPSSAGTDLTSIQKASPKVAAAAHAVRVSANRLDAIDPTHLLPQVSEPLKRAKEQLQGVTSTLDAAADASKIAPAMLGSADKRSYLLMVQNNAEARASGGIPGALAVLTVDKGKLTLSNQTSATALGSMAPPLRVDDEQEQIYSARLGQFFQDVNLTPDFPTSARTAHAMWKMKTGQQVDGVVSIDPVALGYILQATGPVRLNDPELISLARRGLATELNSKNVVPTLLSEVYAKIEEPALQDAYFAGVAKELFSALADGRSDSKKIVAGIAKGAADGRVLVWSASADEESVIAKYPVSGSIAGPSISPAHFGVYFNDGTGAKMDYYVKRTVQLVEECPNGEYGQVKVRISSTNTAPMDAATSLSEYVTGGGAFGVPPGTVQSNIVAYGPVQAHVEKALADGKKIGFASHLHSGRPVGTVTVVLPPGKSSTVEFTFGKIVQHAEPKLTVTPTVQPLKDVVLSTIPKTCVPAA